MTDQERIKFLESALAECFDAAIPQAMPWAGSLSEKATYAARMLPNHLRGLNRLLDSRGREIAELRGNGGEET